MRSIIFGVDAFDPRIYEKLAADGRLPNFSALAGSGGFSHLAISNPAQSEVSWSSIATGLNPGGHGLFDFVHRDPASYALQVSLLPTARSALGTTFVPPHDARTLFDHAIEKGYPATSLWWPATFPAKPAVPVNTIPGLGTPDIFGQLGVGVYFTTESGLDPKAYKSHLALLKSEAMETFSAVLAGPVKGNGDPASLKISLTQKPGDSAQLTIEDQHQINLFAGKWSPVLELKFKTGMLSAISVITRVIYKSSPYPALYFLPLQIHPLKAPWHYGTSPGFVKKAWQENGPFLTLGWPQDTTAFEEGIIIADEFLSLCDSIVATREKVFNQQVDGFQEGVLAIVFDTLDRIQHMFFQQDMQVVEDWYVKFDSILGRLLARLRQPEYKNTRLIAISDHGFAPFDHKVHLNRWLIENGYQSVNGADDQRTNIEVDFDHTEAYAIGLNSLYLNLAGREGHGTLPADQLANKSAEIREKLLNWRENGKQVFANVWLRDEVFEGQNAKHAPDLMMGYAPGFRASPRTGLGGYASRAVEANNDRWHADHCIDPVQVPGSLFANVDLSSLPHPSYMDIPELVLGEGYQPKGGATREVSSVEDRETIEERLKGLGYL
jgi:predicted AlkP superfamily phosphohydrolase/phosphomutase